MANCAKCGAELLEGQVVCTACGTLVEPTTTSEWARVDNAAPTEMPAGQGTSLAGYTPIQAGSPGTPPAPGYTRVDAGGVAGNAAQASPAAAGGYAPVQTAAPTAAPIPGYTPVQSATASPTATPGYTPVQSAAPSAAPVPGYMPVQGGGPGGPAGPASVAMSGSPQVGAPKKKSALPKIIAAIIIVLFLFLAAGVAGVAYLVHKAKQKVAQIEREARNGTLLQNHSGSSNGTHKHSYPPPVAPLKPDVASAPVAAIAATGDRAKDWAQQYERTVNGPEADLVVRAGSINNLGFGWPDGFDPFTGESTPMHAYPWDPRVGVANGTDRIMLGSSVSGGVYSGGGDGYSTILRKCASWGPQPYPPCQARQDSMPRPITLPMGALPSKIDAVMFQIFVDDFQSPVFKSHFQVSLNGTRIPSFEEAVNALDQTGPIGKLISLRLLPEYWPLLQSGDVKLLIDDPTTKVQDGYAVDFVRVLVNPHGMKYTVSLAVNVVDDEKRTPIPGATVTAALVSGTTDAHGRCELKELPAGLVMASASYPGYDANSVQTDLPAGQSGTAEIRLQRHQEDTASLEKSIEQTGTATLYGIHFDTGSAKLRPDSLPALEAILGVLQKYPGSNWIIAGHTDNQGTDAKNIPLSQARATAVIAWLVGHGITENRLQPQGYGASRPVADNATPDGRALNRRVEFSKDAKQ